MHRYTISKRLGDGTYGEVVRAVNNQSGEVVAVKRMKRKYYSWDDCIALREVQSLRKLRHPNIVKLKEIIRENDRLHMVFEHMDCNLYELTKNRRKHLPEDRIKNHMYQIIQGLNYMHKNGYFHRDMKPENILVLNNDITKIADFGLAKEVNAKGPYTEYISTRWYRAPEVLLRSRFYNAPVDVFAVGCIMAELYMLRPLFPGNGENDMIQKVCQVLGTPDKNDWPDGYKLAQQRRVKFPEYPRTPLEKIMPHASAEGIEVMDGLMMWNPDARLTAATCQAHKYFTLERERYEAKERERAREKDRERRERRDKERAAPDPEGRRERAKDSERPLNQSTDDALSTATLPSLLPASLRPTARDRYPEGHVQTRMSLADGGGTEKPRQPPGHVEKWRSEATNTEMSRSVTEKKDALRGMDTVSEQESGGGASHGRKRPGGVGEGRGLMYGNNDLQYGNGNIGHGTDGGLSAYANGPLEEELEGTQQLLGRIRGNRQKNPQQMQQMLPKESERASDRDYSGMASMRHQGGLTREQGGGGGGNLRDVPLSQMPRDHVRQEPASSRSYLGFAGRQGNAQAGGGMPFGAMAAAGRGAGSMGASPYALAPAPRQPAAVARALGLQGGASSLLQGGKSLLPRVNGAGVASTRDSRDKWGGSKDQQNLLPMMGLGCVCGCGCGCGCLVWLGVCVCVCVYACVFGVWVCKCVCVCVCVCVAVTVSVSVYV